MFKLLSGVLIIGSLLFSATSSAKECIFNQDQIKLLKYSYERGKEHDLQWTLAAITWQESGAGRALKNPTSHAYGPYGNLLRTVESRLRDPKFVETLPRIPLTRDAIINLLKHDWEFSSQMAIVELQNWERVHKGNRQKAIASYFGGYTPNTPAAKRYLSQVNSKISYLKNSECQISE